MRSATTMSVAMRTATWVSVRSMIGQAMPRMRLATWLFAMRSRRLNPRALSDLRRLVLAAIGRRDGEDISDKVTVRCTAGVGENTLWPRLAKSQAVGSFQGSTALGSVVGHEILVAPLASPNPVLHISGCRREESRNDPARAGTRERIVRSFGPGGK